MTNPYEVLGLPPNADEAALRGRYLELVRQHPPDRSPARFAEIRAAYDELRNPANRLERLIFLPSEDSLRDVLASFRTRLLGARIPVDLLLSLAED
jgi:curved DNA-binding protein CbpA